MNTIYSIKYEDKHVAALLYKKILVTGESLGIIACGLERFKSKNRRFRSYLKLCLVLANDKDLPALLKILHNSLKDHPLYEYLSFDYIAVPMTQTEWNFDSYDDLNYQKIFIQKRKK